MSKPTKATRYIHESANRFKNSGCSIDWDSSFSTVTISCKGEEDIFMQGDEADEFISEIEVLTKRYRSLDSYTAACALAEPITESLFN